MKTGRVDYTLLPQIIASPADGEEVVNSDRLEALNGDIENYVLLSTPVNTWVEITADSAVFAQIIQTSTAAGTVFFDIGLQAAATTFTITFQMEANSQARSQGCALVLNTGDYVRRRQSGTVSSWEVRQATLVRS